MKNNRTKGRSGTVILFLADGWEYPWPNTTRYVAPTKGAFKGMVMDCDSLLAKGLGWPGKLNPNVTWMNIRLIT